MDIASKYKDIVLAHRNYKADKQLFTVEDFLIAGVLREILDEIITGESDITVDGKNFLNDYGYESILIVLDSVGGLREENLKTAKQIKDWFENVEPNEISKFIVEAREKNLSG